MNDEDEAFENLAKRQGDWGMQGSRKHQILRYAENVESKGTSMTDKDAMAMALDALEYWDVHGKLHQPTEEAITALKERLAQEKTLQALHNENERLGLYRDAYAEQEPQDWKTPPKEDAPLVKWAKEQTTPPQRTEQNFCPRCGKRTKDMTHIHTCTPPKD